MFVNSNIGCFVLWKTHEGCRGARAASNILVLTAGLFAEAALLVEVFERSESSMRRAPGLG
jgi:hypothetical protein